MASRDPTGTGTLRAAWNADLGQRVKKAEALMSTLLDTNAGIGLTFGHYKVALDRHIGGDWPVHYMQRAFTVGTKFAWSRMKEPFSKPPFIAETQLRDKLTQKALSDMLGVIEETAKQLTVTVSATGSLGEAKDAMRGRMSSILNTRGMAVGSSSIVGAHAGATLLAYQYAGIKKLGVDVETVPTQHDHAFDAIAATAVAISRGRKGKASKRRAKKEAARSITRAEFVTQGDDKVCPECEDLDGQVFSFDEADGVIPVHPGCRCAWVPVEEDKDE